jgi:hypothetical protein
MGKEGGQVMDSGWEDGWVGGWVGGQVVRSITGGLVDWWVSGR